MSTSAHERKCWQSECAARDIANSLFQKWAVKGFFRRVSAANRGRGQPRRGYRRPKPTAHSDVGRFRSRRAAGFLLHTFLSPPKEKCERPIGLQALPSRRSRRVRPRQGEFLAAKLSPVDASRGLSSGQTIGAVRTAVRPACCLPELRGANRLRRLCPLGTRFPTFPPAPLRIAIRSNRAPRRAASTFPRTGVGASCPCRGQKPAPPCATPFSIALLLFGVPNVPDAESLSFSSFLSQPKGKEGPPPLG